MSHGNRIIKDSITYTTAALVSQFIGVFTSIAMRRFLTPEMMGIWTILLLVISYSLFADLGIFNAIVVKIPYLRGKNADTEIQNIRNAAFTVAIMASLITILILFAVSFITASRMPGQVVLGIRVTALIVAATFFYNLYSFMLRADKEFFLLSKAIVVNSLAMLVFVSVLTYFFKLGGMCFAAFFANVISWIYVKYNSRYTLKLNFNLNLIRSLLKISLPIVAAGVAYIVLLSIDKLMIIRMLGPEELGFYSIAILVLTLSCSFPALFSMVLFPTIREEFGKHDSMEHILGYVKKSLFIIAYAFPVFLALMYYGTPILVHYVLPKYILGIDSMKMLLCGCFFISLALFMNDFIMTINRQIVLIPITIMAVLFGIVINYGAIKMGYGIVGAAFGTSIAYFVYFTAMLFYVLAQCEEWLNICKYFFKICTPFIYSLIMVTILEHFARIDSLIMGSTVQLFIFSAAYIPVLLYLNNKTGIFSKLFRIRRLP